MLLFPSGMTENFWAETDTAILQCLREQGAMSPVDLARRLGISPGESTAFVCLLAAQGKIKVRLVELEEEQSSRPVPARARRERSRRPARELAPFR
jgi:DNA-binding Lrp family transcriptional regulator